MARNEKAATNRPRFRLGPGLLVTAAFIGPGTVVTASKAGAGFGCELLWTIVFAAVGAIVLQLLAARLGIVNKVGLGQSIRNSLTDSPLLAPVIVLMAGAIGVGNAAYQTGNLTGAAAGIENVAGGNNVFWIALIAAITGVLLAIGRYRVLQTVLIGLVVLLSVCFLGAAALWLPPLDQIARGLFMPQINAENLTLVVALIGTTIVPYNLFLHASTSAECWRDEDTATALRSAHWDTILSISLGGCVTAAILLTASAAFSDRESTIAATADIADQLRPVLGDFSSIAFAIGLFAAGVTSSITAPLATSYALCGIMGWKSEPSSWRFRGIALAVLLIGAAMAILFGKSPVQTIIFAQVANGILLPVVALLMMTAITKQNLGPHRIGKWAWLCAWAIVIAVSTLGIWRAYTAIAPLIVS